MNCSHIYRYIITHSVFKIDKYPKCHKYILYVKKIVLFFFGWKSQHMYIKHQFEELAIVIIIII